VETLLVERDGGLRGLVTVTLNRPEKLNPINGRMHHEVIELCRSLEDDAEARVVIFTGAGRAFSAGADLGSSAGGQTRQAAALGPSPGPLARRHIATLGNRSSAAIEGLPQVTIAAVNGLAVGGAVVWLSCMDIRLAAESAWFSIPEVDLDIPLTWNALPRLVRELGPARTKELVMACDRFTAAEALRWGFVNHVVPDAELIPKARELAARLLAKDAMAVAQTKSTVNALANLMVPAEATHADPDYLVLAGLLQERRLSVEP
jgi:enoyl-CoA hydratase/carnithine racemase